MRKTLWEPSGWPALLLVAVLTVCAYLPARRGGFIWDDVMNVSNNPVMTEAGGLRRIWVPGGTPQYYPATYTAFWAERRLLGLDTRGYHAVNVALHVANLILVWLVLKRLKVRGALLAAAVFALHPVQVETVAWITELKNLLSTLFYLLALLQFLRFEERGSRGCYAGSLALYLLALLNKTAVCTFPLVLLILRWRDRGKLVRRDLLETAPFLALSAALGLVTIHVEGAGGEFALSPVERLLLACRAPWFYASKLAWPAGLSFNYDRWRFDSCAPGQWAWVALSGAAALACWRWRRRLGKDALAALAFFVLTLAPVLGFFDVFYYRYSYVADHFQYLASLGLICLAAGACTKLIERGGASRRRAAFACAGAAVALLWTATWRRAHAFQDVETLYRDTIAKTPAAYMAQSNLANILAARGEHREALRHYAAALAADPRIAEVHTNIGHSLEKLGRRDEEIRHYREAIKLKPGYVNARNDLGVVLSAQGRTLEAAGQFEAALAADPRSIEAHVNLGHCLERLGRRDEEIRHYREALR
ncbi:MAG: tetratricopeptide repeat protein, partial [Elusimicrobia bacterium]|nr:tetratricopeptide repeat protein [Elusimicrobiota bacterium]